MLLAWLLLNASLQPYIELSESYIFNLEPCLNCTSDSSSSSDPVAPPCTVSREALRWTIFSMQTTGHILLGSSFYIEQLLENEEQAEKSMMLPQGSRIRQLQSMLLGKRHTDDG